MDSCQDGFKISPESTTLIDYAGQPRFDHLHVRNNDDNEIGLVIFNRELQAELAKSGLYQVISCGMPNLDVVLARIQFDQNPY